MSNRLLRNIAISIGAGLGVGISGTFVSTFVSRQPRRPVPELQPVLSRLEEIEGRIARVELAPPVLAPPPEEIAALGTLVSSQSEDIDSLRREINRIEMRNAEQAEALAQKMALVEQRVPTSIEANVSGRIADLEQRLRGELKEVHDRTVDAFVETIEKRLVGRIAVIESSLSEQSQSIASLHQKSAKTDEQLNRLLEAVEKLCVRTEAQSQIPILPADRPQPVVEAQRVVVPASSPAPHAEVTQETPLHASRSSEDESFAAHLQRAMETETPLFPGSRALAAAANGRSAPQLAPSHAPQTRRDLRPIGMAILGLAVFGFRLIR